MDNEKEAKRITAERKRLKRKAQTQFARNPKDLRQPRQLM
jgi:hypothetical protein